MKSLLIGWNVMRVVRLLIGLAALVQGIIQKEGLLLAAGGWILFGAIFNVGCCGPNGCAVPTSTKKTNKETDYEELDASK